MRVELRVSILVSISSYADGAALGRGYVRQARVTRARPPRSLIGTALRLAAEVRGRIAAFHDQKASTAVEFALVSAMLIPTILFIIVVGLILYINQALDYATAKASRQIMTGAAQTSGMTQAAFQTLVCSYLPPAVNCSNVIVNVQTTTEAAQPGGYYSFVTTTQSGLIIPTLSNGSAQYSPGTAGSYEYVQVIYPITFIPSLLAPFLGGATYQGSSAYLAVSTAVFRNEQFI